jgi:isopenicillin N synthase-like dioxygenase
VSRSHESARRYPYHISPIHKRYTQFRIGWHNDSGYLTALAGDLYVNHLTGQALTNHPDPAAGLYVIDRLDQVLRVSIPSDCCAIQIGECTQICTGGAVTATPHCVRGGVNGSNSSSSSSNDVARISLACFIDLKPSTELRLPVNSTREQVLAACLPSARVPPLADRWTADSMTFGEFLEATFSLYYNWTAASDNTTSAAEEKKDNGNKVHIQ